jgi:hypothetical protein
MVKNDEILTKEGIILRVGDTVEITRSNSNWNYGGSMDSYVGKRVTITNIYGSDKITFIKHGEWAWRYSDGHFKPVNVVHEVW